MLKLKKVAVTGGLSCGKSSVCQLLKELGAYVISSDEVVHLLLSPETKVGQRVIELLGPDIVVKGRIDRSQIARKVFGNETLLRSLENLLHPAVTAEVEKQYALIEYSGRYPLFIVEVPLLFETDSNRFFDVNVAVVAEPEICLQRFILNKGYDKSEYEKRMARQLAIQEKAKLADYVIANNGNREELRENVKALFAHLHKEK